MAQSRLNELVEKATILFSQRGFSATGMRELANVMNIEAASLYSHIHSKEELLEIICFRLANKLQLGLDEVNDIYFDAEERLKIAIKNHVMVVCENTDAAKVLIDEWRYLIEPHKTNFIEKRNHYEQGFLNILKSGEEENIFKEVHSKFAVLMILSTLNWLNQWYSKSGSMKPEQIAEQISHFILTGIKK